MKSINERKKWKFTLITLNCNDDNDTSRIKEKKPGNFCNINAIHICMSMSIAKTVIVKHTFLIRR